MAKDHEAMTDEQLLKWINNAMAEPLERPEEDIGVDVALKHARARERQQGQFVGGYRIELVGKHESKLTTEFRPLPKPPYRCVCGTVFATAQELLDHRHEPTKVSSW